MTEVRATPASLSAASATVRSTTSPSEPESAGPTVWVTGTAIGATGEIGAGMIGGGVTGTIGTPQTGSGKTGGRPGDRWRRGWGKTLSTSAVVVVGDATVPQPPIPNEPPAFPPGFAVVPKSGTADNAAAEMVKVSVPVYPASAVYVSSAASTSMAGPINSIEDVPSPSTVRPKSVGTSSVPCCTLIVTSTTAAPVTDTPLMAIGFPLVTWTGKEGSTITGAGSAGGRGYVARELRDDDVDDGERGLRAAVAHVIAADAERVAACVANVGCIGQSVQCAIDVGHRAGKGHR